MAKRNKPNLKNALNKVDNMSDSYFGKIDIDIKSLPCFSKPTKEKITANFDADLLETIRSIAKKNNVSYTSLINDVLRKVFISDKKA
ncbi:MAG: hypothetical protein ISR65_02530 [Bacteriovoracaceae bacterium]|nr:hypothetical protein [Bacteriovoracaceae bacterium]